MIFRAIRNKLNSFKNCTRFDLQICELVQFIPNCMENHLVWLHGWLVFVLLCVHAVVTNHKRNNTIRRNTKIQNINYNNLSCWHVASLHTNERTYIKSYTYKLYNQPVYNWMNVCEARARGYLDLVWQGCAVQKSGEDPHIHIF